MTWTTHFHKTVEVKKSMFNLVKPAKISAPSTALMVSFIAGQIHNMNLLDKHQQFVFLSVSILCKTSILYVIFLCYNFCNEQIYG